MQNLLFFCNALKFLLLIIFFRSNLIVLIIVFHVLSESLSHLWYPNKKLMNDLHVVNGHVNFYAVIEVQKNNWKNNFITALYFY